MYKLTAKENKIFILSIYVQFCLWMLQLLIYEFIGGGVVASVHVFVSIIRAITLIASAYLWLKYNAMEMAWGYLICFFIYITQIIIYPENRLYINEYVFDFFVIALSCYFNMKFINDENLHIKMMQVFAWIVFFLGEIYFILFWEKISYDETYSMAYTNYMLFSLVVFIYTFFEEKKTLYIIPILFSVLSMLLIGSRGAIVASVAYFLFLVFMSKKITMIRVAIILILIGVCVNLSRIFELMVEFFRKMGINSRSIDFLISGEFISYDSGRSNLYLKSIELIKLHPYIGNGIGADSRVLHTYTHNLFLDILVQFGLVIGITIIICMLVIMVLGLLKTDNKALYFLFFFLGFFPLMVSGTYLTQITFWMYMGYCMGRMKIRVT